MTNRVAVVVVSFLAALLPFFQRHTRVRAGGTFHTQRLVLVRYSLSMT